MGLEKVEESERGSGEDNGLVELKEGCEVELVVAEQKWGGILWIKRLVELRGRSWGFLPEEGSGKREGDRESGLSNE